MWSDNQIHVLFQFLKKRGMKHEDARSVLGVVLLACGHEACSAQLDAIDAASVPLDSPLLSRILEGTSARRIAQILWSPVGLRLSVEHFESLFQRVLSDRKDDRSLYEAVGGAVDFLRRHPLAFLVPQEPLRRLIESENDQVRVVALKGMSHSDIPSVDHFNWILSCLEGTHEDERLAALHCLGELLDRMSSEDIRLLGAELLHRVDRSLEAWTRGGDRDAQMAAETHRFRLREKCVDLQSPSDT